MSTEEPTIRIRPIDREKPEEVGLVAERMKLTLMEVLGEERGAALYSPEWLIARVLWHLDPSVATGAVFVAENLQVGIVGHTIVRMESDADGDYGLFSTTFVTPEAREHGVASLLLNRGEAWMRSLGLSRAMTATSTSNEPLIKLFESHGYSELDRHGEMLRMAQTFSA